MLPSILGAVALFSSPVSARFARKNNLRAMQVDQSVPPPPRSKSGSKFFLWLTDPHVDLYYGTDGQQCHRNASVLALHSFGLIGCDPPMALMDAASAEAASVAAKVGGAEFTIFTGDFVRHRQDEMPDPYANVTTTIQRVTESLVSIGGPEKALVGALGNDDSPLNYELKITSQEPSNNWLRNVGSAFETCGAMNPKTLLQYEYGGFTETEMGGLIVISLDTIIYSVRHTPRPADGEPLLADPFGQFAWLRERLQAAKAGGRVVWIAGHIPPGVESYGYTELWHHEYLNAYRGILVDEGLGSVVAAQLFGHVHASEFRVLSGAPREMGPTMLSGSISPIYRSNPGFRLVEYDPDTGRPLNYLVYYSEMPHVGGKLSWKLGYNAIETYPQLKGSFTNEGVSQLSNVLSIGGPVWNTYASWYKVAYTNDLMHCGRSPLLGNLTEEVRLNCVNVYMCAMHIATRADFLICKSMANSSSPIRARGLPSPGDVQMEPEEDEVVPQSETAEAHAARWERLRAAHWESLGLSSKNFSQDLAKEGDE